MTVVSSPATHEGAQLAAESLARAKALVVPALDGAVLRLCPQLRPAVAEHLAGGGKLVHAGLVLASAAASGAGEATGLVGGVAIELVHNFSLVHDDIIDRDLERRHRPTMWAEHGVGHAIIAGDALVTLAFQILLEEPTSERMGAASHLAEATQAMIAGQAEDMASRVGRLAVCRGVPADGGGKDRSAPVLFPPPWEPSLPVPRRPPSRRSLPSAATSVSPSRPSTISLAFGASRPSPARPSATTCASTKKHSL